MDNIYIYIIIATIIGLIIGSLSCACVYKSLDIDKTIPKSTINIIQEEQTGGQNKYNKNSENELFQSLMPKLNSMNLEGHNVNNYSNYQKL